MGKTNNSSRHAAKPPFFRQCPSCHLEFGSRSLRIHLPRCKENKVTNYSNLIIENNRAVASNYLSGGLDELLTEKHSKKRFETNSRITRNHLRTSRRLQTPVTPLLRWHRTMRRPKFWPASPEKPALPLHRETPKRSQGSTKDEIRKVQKQLRNPKARK